MMNAHPKLNLTPEENKLFGQLFKDAENDSGVITGDVALNFFQRTRLSRDTLGNIWSIADPENRGFLAQEDFAKAMRLIGHYQAQPGRELTPDLTLRPAPLPMFEGVNMPPGKRFDDFPQPIRVPPLQPDRAAEYVRLFDKAGAENGLLPGQIARDFFVQSQLPNSVLSTIWNLADTQQQGALTVVEFIVALHLLFSYKNGTLTALPTTCPPQLFEAARRSVHPDRRPGGPAPSAIPRQFSGEPRTSSPANRGPYRSPQAANDWAVSPQEKTQFDGLFDKIDDQRLGYISGNQAYDWFTNSKLPHETLAQIWELATVRKMDQLNRDEFAVAMHLIKSQRGKATNDLPSVLPPNLVPPTLRSFVPPAAPQPTGYQAPLPVAQPPPPAQAPPKSAAEDLFGLDELSSPVAAPVQPVQQQTTGGSGRAFSSDPFGTKTSASPTSSTFQPPGFKRFVPTSSFGQNLQAQTTGGSGTSSTRDVTSPATRAAPTSAMDDLLGDADPEVSKRLTNETAELANMSNQIGQLRTQTQEVQTKKTVTESDINRISTQKRDLELRLSQFRQQYEEEVKAVKALEQQLQSLRSDTQNVSREMAMLEGTYQDLQSQHRQAAAALEHERRENASLKERMAQINQEIARLRPDLDKMRSETRHEKGMVSINKKQLERSETERDNIKSEMDDLKPTSTAPPAISREASNVASTASAASHSTNPFFRKSPQPSFDQPSSARSPTEDHNKFGNIWGTAFSSSSVTTAPPQTSFGRFESQSGPSVGSSEANVPTPSASPPTSSYRDSPRGAVPPELPESRQFTPGDLPIRGAGTESTASVRVETPGSRWEGTATPTAPSTSSPAQPNLGRSETNRSEVTSTGAAMFDRAKSASPVVGKPTEHAESSRGFAPSGTIPGAFPGTTSSPLQSNLTGESSFTSGSKDTPRTDTFSPFSTGGQARAPSNAWKGDFDAAFASLAPTQQRQTTGSSANGAVDPLKKAEHQFPPIQINEEDSDDSDLGFENDFTVPSPESKKTVTGPSGSSRPTAGHDDNDDFFKPRTATAASPQDLPPVAAQKSPPTYEQTAGTSSSTAAGAAREANNFPPEFGGLLPPRETAASPPQPTQSPSQGAALFGGSGGFFGDAPKPGETTSSSTVPSGDYQSAVSQQSMADRSTTQTSLTHGGPSKPFGSFGGTDDFDNFDDLEDAKADDGKDEDIFGPDNSFETFDPSFDSPAASKSNTLASEFDSGFGKSSTMAASGVNKSANSHSWDDLMKGVDAPMPPTASSTEFKRSSPFPDLSASGSSSKPFGESSAGNMQFPPEAPEPPKLGRALSEGTEHDDPILKTLTAMGYDRKLALETLEKYDYNLEKAAEHLASPH